MLLEIRYEILWPSLHLKGSVYPFYWLCINSNMKQPRTTTKLCERQQSPGWLKIHTLKMERHIVRNSYQNPGKNMYREWYAYCNFSSRITIVFCHILGKFTRTSRIIYLLVMFKTNNEMKGWFHLIRSFFNKIWKKSFEAKQTRTHKMFSFFKWSIHLAVSCLNISNKTTVD